MCGCVEVFEVLLFFDQKLQRIVRLIQTLQSDLPHLLQPQRHLNNHRHNVGATQTSVIVVVMVSYDWDVCTAHESVDVLQSLQISEDILSELCSK